MRHANKVSTSSAVPPPLPTEWLAKAALVPRDTGATTPLHDQVAGQTLFSTGATLFHPGERRHALRIESGAACQFQRWPDGRVDMFECAFPGDVIGLGYLPDHTSSAVAMVDTVVSVMPTDTLEQRLASDDRLALSLAAAGEREFEFLRAKSVRSALLPPLQKVANYLLAVASIEQSEGRESVLVSDEVASGFVASQLRMSIDTLSMALLSLRRSGIVDLTGNRLKIVDVDRLEAVAASN